MTEGAKGVAPVDRNTQADELTRLQRDHEARAAQLRRMRTEVTRATYGLLRSQPVGTVIRWRHGTETTFQYAVKARASDSTSASWDTGKGIQATSVTDQTLAESIGPAALTVAQAWGPMRPWQPEPEGPAQPLDESVLNPA